MLALFLASQAVVLFLVRYNSKANLIGFDGRNWYFSRDPDDIGFYVYRNSKNPDDYKEIVYLNATSLTESGYNRDLPVVFLIHGLLANKSTAADVRKIKNAYLSVNFPANIIMVDYGELAGVNLPGFDSVPNLPVSLFANSNAPIVGRRVAEFVQFLIQNGALSGPDKVHLIGFSLGCHVSGAAGTHVKKILGAQIARISGLDCPGGQLRGDILLDKSDAAFVDVTHTSLGRISGILGQIGHADFFMNAGGPKQPSCNPVFLYSDPYCSHVTSVYYFAKSIRDQKITACKCQICAFYFTVCPVGNLDTYGQYVSRRTKSHSLTCDFRSFSAKGKYYVKIS